MLPYVWEFNDEAEPENPAEREEEPGMKMVELRPDLRMVLDQGPGQAYLLRRGSEAVLIDTGIAGQGDSVAAALRD